MNLLQMSISGGVLIAAAALLRAFMLNRLPKRTFTALWTVAFCRLLLPVSVPTRWSVYNALPVNRAALGGLVQPGGPALTGPTTASPTAFPWLAVIWCAGCLLCAGWFAVSYVRCRREFRTALPVDCAFVRDWLQEHQLRRTYTIRQTDRVSTPLTYGFVRPVILLPRTVDWQDETQLRYILTHEYIHIRRFDAAYKLCLAAAFCAHWFNPLVWALYGLANRDLELACDEQVVRLLGRANRAGYARALIRMEASRPTATHLYNHFSKNAAEERIRSIMKSKKYPLIGIVLALLLVAGVTIAFASSPQSDPDLSAQQAVAQLTESIRYQEGQISFRLPEGYAAAENWNIQIAGRLELDGMDMSAHFLEEQNTGHTWEAGRTYRFAAEPESYTELTLYAALPNADGSWAEQEVDLLQRIG